MLKLTKWAFRVPGAPLALTYQKEGIGIAPGNSKAATLGLRLTPNRWIPIATPPIGERLGPDQILVRLLSLDDDETPALAGQSSLPSVGLLS